MSDALVVTSKIKKLIKEKADMNTSQETIEQLSYAVERLIERGIEMARADKRKTVMGRDIIVEHI
jgi:histone H3/H4